jgi:hypothetical protein
MRPRESAVVQVFDHASAPRQVRGSFRTSLLEDEVESKRESKSAIM